MMHQPVKPYELEIKAPEREAIIQKDEIINLEIDLAVLTFEEFLERYFE